MLNKYAQTQQHTTTMNINYLFYLRRFFVPSIRVFSTDRMRPIPLTIRALLWCIFMLHHSAFASDISLYNNHLHGLTQEQAASRCKEIQAKQSNCLKECHRKYAISDLQDEKKLDPLIECNRLKCEAIGKDVGDMCRYIRFPQYKEYNDCLRKGFEEEQKCTMACYKKHAKEDRLHFKENGAPTAGNKCVYENHCFDLGSTNTKKCKTLFNPPSGE